MQHPLVTAAAFLSTSFLLCAQTNPPALADQNPQTEAVQTFQKLERQWAEAVKRQDVGAINRIQADDYEFIGPAGEIWTKARSLDFIRAGKLAITSFELSEFNVRIYGDTAVVSFRVVWNGSSGGNDISGPQRMTDVFVKRDGRWQCVSSQTTRIRQ